MHDFCINGDGNVYLFIIEADSRKQNRCFPDERNVFRVWTKLTSSEDGTRSVR